eukprot:Rhum_TRINITY_DN4829_c0_g1::Rhum_TRINITY_DN4829_c0_g1_i1::g.15863::m.15863
MASTINNAIFQFCMKHSDDPKQRTEGIPPRDPNDYDWLRGALAEIKSDAERMEECLGIATNPEITDVDSKVIAMEECLYFVEDLDNASDFVKTVKGTKKIIALITTDVDACLREGAANIMGTCCQNNIIAQGCFLADGALATVLLQLQKEENARTRTKLIYAISSLVRGNSSTITAFFATPGAMETVAGIVAAHPEDTRSCKKAFFLLTALFRDVPTSVTPRPTPPADAATIGAVQRVLKTKTEDPDYQELVVNYCLELVKHGKKEAILANGFTAADVTDAEQQARLAAALA